VPMTDDGGVASVEIVSDNGMLYLSCNSAQILVPLQTSCGWWSSEASDWLPDGCTTSERVIDNTVTCHCSHLTNFAILVSSQARSRSSTSGSASAEAKALATITIISCVVAILVLVAIGEEKWRKGWRNGGGRKA
jgi:hypothetical protein